MDPGNLTGPQLLAQSQDVRDRVARCLRGLSAPASERPPDGTPAFRVRVPWGRPLDPWAVRFCVVDVIGGHDVGMGEKQAWGAPVEMDGTLIWFRHTKLGVSATVFGIETQEAADQTVADCMRRMGKAIPVVSRDLIDPLVADAVTRGACTVPNKFEYFHGMYAYLRRLSEATAAKAAVSKPVRKTFQGESSMSFPGIVLARNAEY